jgi:molybdopterin-guanine dinucleotide biosynthesis protein B
MRQRMPRILNVVGCKNSGKTRFIELIVPVFKRLRLKVGTLKHTHHDGFDWDIEGKDTYRHFKSGSDVTGIFGTRSFAFNLNNIDIRPRNVDDLAGVFYREMDLVLIEGLETDSGPKIEVCRPGYSDRQITPRDKLLATYGADLFNHGIPHFDYGSESELGEFIVSNIHRLRRAVSN